VICVPNNFAYGEGQALPEGIFRVTCLANYGPWAERAEEAYRAEKVRWFEAVQRSALRFMPALTEGDELIEATVATDMFTPCTVERYTGHQRGAIYGSPDKFRDGRTALANVYLCGTDQGFLGITGALLSGISMANYHILQREVPGGGAA